MMAIKSNDNIYSVIEEALQGREEPMTCADLMDIPAVKKEALRRYGPDLQLATNKLSDLLGFMWRRTVLERYPAPPSRSLARYAYKLAVKKESKPVTPISPPTPLFKKQAVEIIEKDGEVTIEFDRFTIIVRPK